MRNVCLTWVEAAGGTMRDAGASFPLSHVSGFLLGHMAWLPATQLPAVVSVLHDRPTQWYTQSSFTGIAVSCFLPSSLSLQPSAVFSAIQRMTHSPTSSKRSGSQPVEWGIYRFVPCALSFSLELVVRPYPANSMFFRVF